MTCRRIKPPTPVFRTSYIYWGEVIPYGFVAFEDYSQAADYYIPIIHSRLYQKEKGFLHANLYRDNGDGSRCHHHGIG